MFNYISFVLADAYSSPIWNDVRLSHPSCSNSVCHTTEGADTDRIGRTCSSLGKALPSDVRLWRSGLLGLEGEPKTPTVHLERIYEVYDIHILYMCWKITIYTYILIYILLNFMYDMYIFMYDTNMYKILNYKLYMIYSYVSAHLYAALCLANICAKSR